MEVMPHYSAIRVGCACCLGGLPVRLFVVYAYLSEFYSKTLRLLFGKQLAMFFSETSEFSINVEL